MRVGLAAMQDLCARLGDPHRAFRSVQVAGTKGKGSVSALIEAGLVRAGLSAGRYASPHVEHVTERVSLQGRDVDQGALAWGLTCALDAYEAARSERTAAADATWFDLLTSAAYVIFREARVEWAVVEVGLGGRLDSTNVVDGEIAVVTNIGLEHTEILGETRQAIAREKVGILKTGAVLVATLGRDDAAGRVLQARADELGCPVAPVGVAPDATIEETNVALAGFALDQLGKRGVRTRSGEPVGAGLLDARTRAAARLIGRMERHDIEVGASRVPLVFDGAHVPFNLAAVLADLSRAPDLALHAVIGAREGEAQRVAVGAGPCHLGTREEPRERGFADLGVDLAVVLVLDPGLRRLVEEGEREIGQVFQHGDQPALDRTQNASCLAFW